LKTNEKIFLPSHYINIIKSSNNKNPFKIVYLNHPLTNDLKPDVNPIIKINDYKKIFNPFIKPKLDYCSEVRLIKFKKNSCKISLTLNEPKFTALNLFKNNFDSNSLIERIDTIELAYGNFCLLIETNFMTLINSLNRLFCPKM
jgi:hypothetical protein